MAIIRTERASVLWAEESAFGSLPGSGWKRFGIHEAVNVADPEYEWAPFFGIFSTRGRQTILRGRESFRGTVPDIRLQGNNTWIMKMILGRRSGNDYVDDYRQVSIPFPSFTMAVGLKDSDGNWALIRDYLGGRVNRATLFANEGEDLRLSLDELLFKDMIHNISGKGKYSASATAGSDPGPISTGRFMFSAAEININGVVFAHIRRFSLTIDNQLETKYYLSRADSADGSQHPKDLVPGKQVYRLETELDMADPVIDRDIWEFLVNQGASTWPGNTLGAQISIYFTSISETGGSYRFEIHCSATGVSATHPGAVLLSAPAHIPAPPTGLVPQMATWDVGDVTVYAEQY